MVASAVAHTVAVTTAGSVAMTVGSSYLIEAVAEALLQPL